MKPRNSDPLRVPLKKSAPACPPQTESPSPHKKSPFNIMLPCNEEHYSCAAINSMCNVCDVWDSSQEVSLGITQQKVMLLLKQVILFPVLISSFHDAMY